MLSRELTLLSSSGYKEVASSKDASKYGSTFVFLDEDGAMPFPLNLL